MRTNYRKNTFIKEKNCSHVQLKRTVKKTIYNFEDIFDAASEIIVCSDQLVLAHTDFYMHNDIF